MSHRSGLRSGWHGCCSIYLNEGRRKPGRKRSKLGIRTRYGCGRGRDARRHRTDRTTTRRATPPHTSKRPIPRLKRGFFCAPRAKKARQPGGRLTALPEERTDRPRQACKPHPPGAGFAICPGPGPAALAPGPSGAHRTSTTLQGTQPHFESPQFRQVMQPSIMTSAAVLHFEHSCAPSGKCDFEKASACLVRASNSARFVSTSFC